MSEPTVGTGRAPNKDLSNLDHKFDTKAGFVTLLGAPNAGKSTLANRCVNSKFTIVSHKAQTTRMPLRGIASRGRSQMVFVDTPGIFEPRGRLDHAMVSAAMGSVRDADIASFLFDCQRSAVAIPAQIKRRLNRFKGIKVLILNKIDRIARPLLLEKSAALNDLCDFDRTFMLSALKGDGVDGYLDYLAAQMPSGPWLYPADQTTDAPMRLLCSEMTREILIERLHQELPYQLTVETENIENRSKGGVSISQLVIVRSERHRRMILGSGGATIKSISIRARHALVNALGRPVHLTLFIKVRPHWIDDPQHYKEMGLAFVTPKK